MAKNKRKRKLKEQDFQKVKFKVGKKLKPAENATDSSFKSRGIFVPAQLHTLDSVPTNQRNQTMKDLLAQVGHYSVNTRQQALGGLKDLFQHHENLLHENLGIVIKRICEKMTDSDPSVRQSLLLLLCFIFPLVSQEKMVPFAALVIAHLSCAMTHIYDDIQHDSLGFLELCLRYFPNLMVGSSSQLIQNFVGMISRQNIPGTKQSKGPQHKVGKGLAVNPKGKLSSLRSRLKILQQLLALLKALESSSNSNSNPLSSANLVELPSKKPTIYFDKKKPTRIQVLEHSVEEPTLHSFTFDSGTATTALNTESKNNILTDRQMVKDFMEVIVPLLLECWIECSPAQMTTALPNSMVSSSSIDVMLAVTEILKIVFKAAQEKQTNAKVSEIHKPGDDLLDVYFKDINQHLMSFFPFSVLDTPVVKRGRRKLGKAPQQAMGENSNAPVQTLNLKICEIMMLFVKNGPAVQKNYRTVVHRLEEFVIESLELKASGDAAGQQFQTEQVESLVTFAHQILEYHCSCIKMGIASKPGELLHAAFNLYQSSHIKSGTKRVLINFLASLVFQENMDFSELFEVQELVEKWLLGLPGLLVQLKEATPGLIELVLRVMKKAVVQGVLQSDDKVLSQLAMFFSKDKGSFSKLRGEIQRLAVELLFHLPSLDDQLLANVVSCCHGEQVDVAVIQYLLQVLLYRSPSYEGAVSHPAAFTFEAYLSALLHIAIGYSKYQLSDYQDVNNQAETCEVTDFIGCPFSILHENKGQEVDEANLWQSQQRKLQAVFQCFKHCPFSTLLRLVSQELEQLLLDYKVLPLSAVHSILCVMRCVMQLASDTSSADGNCPFPTFLLLSLTHLTLVCLKHCTRRSFSCSEQKPRSEDLFVEVVELLCAVPQMILEILSHLVAVLSGFTSDDSECVMETCAVILTKLFSCKVRKILLQSPDHVHLLVQRVLNRDNSSTLRKQCFADLQYQYSLFKAEAGQANALSTCTDM